MPRSWKRQSLNSRMTVGQSTGKNLRLRKSAVKGIVRTRCGTFEISRPRSLHDILMHFKLLIAEDNCLNVVLIFVFYSKLQFYTYNAHFVHHLYTCWMYVISYIYIITWTFTSRNNSFHIEVSVVWLKYYFITNDKTFNAWKITRSQNCDKLISRYLSFYIMISNNLIMQWIQ